MAQTRLPAELHVLTEFFETDDRPTAVFGLKDDTSESPDITLDIVRRSRGKLGAHIVGRPNISTRERMSSTELLAETEVPELDVVFVIQEHVLWLDIPVKDWYPRR